MKFFCEYCGARIDLDKDATCPKCGAGYENNKSYLELKKKKDEFDEIELNQKKLIYDQSKFMTEKIFKISKPSKLIFLPIFLFVILIIAAVFLIIKENYFDRKSEYNRKQNTTVVVKNGYSFKIDEVVDNVSVSYKNPSEGMKYIRVKLLVTNNAEGDYYFSFNDVICLVDGIIQKRINDNNHDELPFIISSHTTGQGYYTFEVPEDTKNIQIKMGKETIDAEIS